MLLEIDIIYVYEMYVEWIEMLRNLGKIEFWKFICNELNSYNKSV